MKLNKLVALLLAVTMLFAFVGCPTGNQEPTPQPKPPAPKDPIAKVTFDPRAGVLDEETTITLASKTEGAVIYYEIVEGDAAATLSAKNLTGETIKTYSEDAKPVITKASKIYAIAVKDGDASEVSSAAYTFIDWSTAADMKDGYVDGVTAYVINDLDGLKKLIETVNGVDEVAAEDGSVLVEGVDSNSMEGCVIKLTKDLVINEKVIQKGFLPPKEGENATANPDLVNLDSIGIRDKAFCGTFDGAGHTISGLYIYQGHQGLGFIGATGEDAVIKNLTITDACVINRNFEAAAPVEGKGTDGNDDDRFGGLLGFAQGVTTIKNCVFIGIVGSEEAYARGKPYEYIGGLVGRADSPVKVTDCAVFARIYGDVANVICEKGAENVTGKEDVEAIDYAILTPEYDASAIKNEVVKAAVIKYMPKPKPADVTFEPAAGEVEADKEITLACATEGAEIRYEFVASGSEPTLSVENYADAAVYSDSAKPKVETAGTLYAIAIKDEEVSAITSAVYKIQGDTADPVFAPAAGKVMANDTVAITCETEGADIIYEIVKAGEESTLTISNYADPVYTKYTEAIAITENVTINAVAVKGSKVSMLVSAAYELKVAPLAVAYPETPATTGEEFILAGTKLRFYADLAEEGDKGATVYYQFVKAGETSTLSKDNYADETVATKYEGSIAIAESGTFYCIAEHDGLVTDIVSFAYNVKSAVEAGRAAIASVNIPSVVPTATDDIKDGIKEGVTSYIITDVAGLQKLSEIVNGGNALAGYTFTVANDIVINENVLSADFLEPAEKAAGEATEGLVNLDSIGTGKTIPFSGTFDGNGKTISGFYAYQGHWGLGFFGNIKDAIIKNVIIRDACVINNNVSADGDGEDDDRFGGLIGLSMGGNTITDCIFEGVVGSAAAKARGGAYEYIGGLIGRNDGTSTATNCIILARVYGSGDVITKHNASNVTKENVKGFAVN